MPFGHPFFITVFGGDSVVTIKDRIKSKLMISETEFKQWRFAKIININNFNEYSYSIEPGVRNAQMIRDEDDPLELKQYFFPPAVPNL